MKHYVRPFKTNMAVSNSCQLHVAMVSRMLLLNFREIFPRVKALLLSRSISFRSVNERTATHPRHCGQFSSGPSGQPGSEVSE